MKPTQPVEKPESKKEMQMEAKMPAGWEPKMASKPSGKKLCAKCNRQMSCNC